jgi:hypothetical protein
MVDIAADFATYIWASTLVRGWMMAEGMGPFAPSGMPPLNRNPTPGRKDPTPMANPCVWANCQTPIWKDEYCEAHHPDTTGYCAECRYPDGSVNEEWFWENSGCLFGCGPHVDTDTGFCPSCKDHSANTAECETCGTEYQDWDGKPEAKAASRLGGDR